LYGGGAELSRIDTIVDKRSLQRNLSFCITRRRGESRKVAAQHRSRRHELPHVVGIGTKNRVLKAAEEKQLVLFDGTADCHATLITLQRAVRHRKILAGVEEIIPYKFKQVAMECVGSRLCDGTHGRCTSLLGIQSGALGLELS